MPLDADGYPLDVSLERIEHYDLLTEPLDGLLDLVRENWKWGEPWFSLVNRGRTLKLSTGGWSGNEDVIRALKRNWLFWALYWSSSHTGGHYVFHLPPRSQQRRAALHTGCDHADSFHGADGCLRLACDCKWAGQAPAPPGR